MYVNVPTEIAEAARAHSEGLTPEIGVENLFYPEAQVIAAVLCDPGVQEAVFAALPNVAPLLRRASADRIRKEAEDLESRAREIRERADAVERGELVEA